MLLSRLLGGEANKFLGALVVGAVGWATVIVESAPADITSSEWLYGGSLLAAAVTTFILKNSPPE